MSSISGVSGNGFNFNQVGSYNSVGRQGGDSDGDNDGSRAGKAGRGGMFASALTQALAQIGVSTVAPATPSSSTNASASSTSTPSSGTTSSTQDPQQALSAFMHDLFAALQSPGNTQSTTGGSSQSSGGSDSDGDNDGSGAAGAAGGRHRHGGGMNGIENKLQSLIQQLSSTTSSSNTGATDTTTSALQTDFQNLLSSLGASGNQTSLSSFLQALATNLQQGSNPGLNVSAQA